MDADHGISSSRDISPSYSHASNGRLPTPKLSPRASPEHGDLDSKETVNGNHSEGRNTTNGLALNRAGDEHDSMQDDGLGIDLTPSSSARQLSQGITRRHASSNRLASPVAMGEVLKLSPAQIQELTSSPESLPIRPVTPPAEEDTLHIGHEAQAGSIANTKAFKKGDIVNDGHWPWDHRGTRPNGSHFPPRAFSFQNDSKESHTASTGTAKEERSEGKMSRPRMSNRPQSTPPNSRRRSASRTHSTLPHGARHNKLDKQISPSPRLDTVPGTDAGASQTLNLKPSPMIAEQPSTLLSSVPLPPMSIPTYLELELSSDGPSPLYIEKGANVDNYESSEVKFERLMNFLLLWPELETLLFFGALTCLDSFLYTFTILPLRFFKALSLLLDWFVTNLVREVRYIGIFIYRGFPRWRKNRQRAASIPKRELEKLQALNLPSEHNAIDARPRPLHESSASEGMPTSSSRKVSSMANSKHRRSRSTVSALRPSHKADLIKGLLIVVSSAVLLRFDASRMYHNIRGQNTIKLYLIFNVLEFGGKLLSAFGQDVLECLFSEAVLERDADGRSRIVRPFFMFILALIYNIGHATMLFYQVVTLNVAVNSYSNALLSLLMSNQFVEIKGSVLKKIEKENLFQMTVGDICERFELWLMLTIIALRNLVEVGSLSISISNVLGSSGTTSTTSNATSAPLTSASFLPNAFTVLPRWTGEVLGPFIIVLGSEMFVDYLKHAYITKFNNVKPNVYGRFLDVIAKDYYIHAFGEQSLTKRYGLPVLPLACLSIRAIFQTYHMFLATHMPLPMPSTATTVSIDSATPSATSALAHIDQLFRRALGRSTFGAGAPSDAGSGFSWWSLDDIIALGIMLAVFGVAWLVFLAFKLVLGMMLLSFARQRYMMMKEREKQSVDVEGRRVGAWGAIEVGEEKRRWIYKDDEKGLQKLRERDERARREAREGKMPDLTNVKRYDMVAKRIW